MENVNTTMIIKIIFTLDNKIPITIQIKGKTKKSNVRNNNNNNNNNNNIKGPNKVK